MSLRWRRLIPLALTAVLVALPLSAGAAGSDGFADAAFQQLWNRADLPVARGGAGRSWVWGERVGERRYERFADTAQGARLVQYFDKARMEVNDPAGNRASPWFVTNGLLVVELISGRMQVGLNAFEPRAPAALPAVGDPVANPDAPTYAALRRVATVEGDNRAGSRLGQPVSATLDAAGNVGDRPDLARPETQIVAYEAVTGHNIPRVFRDFMQLRGPVVVGGRTVQDQVVDPLFAFGYPITEPYWVQARVGGRPTTLLVQAFERRVLTYSPANPDPWKVEMGNVGQHYFAWRYGRALHYAQPPLTGGLRVAEASVTIPTYDYAAALVPTPPSDPIHPYPRLDWSRVGPVQPRTYRTLVVENRFLELTFLPEFGGRLYRAVDKATGQNIFYQNPVIKPSPFGQRGWWLGVGGLEWAAPTEEHGYLEDRPWDITLSRAGDGVTVRAAAREAQTGLDVVGTVELRADEGRFRVAMEAANRTGGPRPLQMWTNATLSPGGANNIGAGLRFIAPTDRMIVHATQDRALPGPGAWIVWPRHDGRDLSRPANWTGYLGVFSPTPLPFLGVYDTTRDAGAATVHGPGVPGGKLFGFSPNFDRSVYTDDGSEYVELWSGAQPTFWDYPPLENGATRAITADWLPLWGLGDLATASRDAALGLTRRADGGLTVALASARVTPGAVVVVRLDGREVFRSAALELRPDQPLVIDLPAASSAGRQLRVEAPGGVLELSVER